MSNLDPINPKTNYLLVKLTCSVEDCGFDHHPVAIVPLDADFFNWMDERRSVLETATGLGLTHAVFNCGVIIVDLAEFDPDTYIAEEDQVLLKPVWAELEIEYAVVTGQLMLDLEIVDKETQALREMEDFRTSSEFRTLSMMPVYQKPSTVSLQVEVDLKHTYEPWGSINIEYDALRLKYRSTVL